MNIRFFILFLLHLFVSQFVYAFESGEKLTFVVSYGMINAAEATLEVSDTNYLDKIPAYRITSTARTYPFFDKFFRVRDNIESIWDKKGKSSLQFTKSLSEGKYRQLRVCVYDQEKLTCTYRRFQFKENRFLEATVQILPYTQDIFSAFYLTRQKDLVVGKDIYINVSTDGKNYPVKVVVHRKEIIDTIFGRKECLVIEPKMRAEGIFKQTGEVLIWVTNDDAKVPVQMESQIKFGKFRARLKDAQNVPYAKK